MNINILNMHSRKPQRPCDVKIDRSSPLGNPFYMHYESERDKVCEKYKVWIEEHRYDTKIKKELERLCIIYRNYQELNLFCWCAPKRCHGETIKQIVEDMLNG